MFWTFYFVSVKRKTGFVWKCICFIFKYLKSILKDILKIVGINYGLRSAMNAVLITMTSIPFAQVSVSVHSGHDQKKPLTFHTGLSRHLTTARLSSEKKTIYIVFTFLYYRGRRIQSEKLVYCQNCCYEDVYNQMNITVERFRGGRLRLLTTWQGR